ncbi:MAG: hypothetical protein JKY13_01760 [Gammaproteobacteria bacterium]|nr:hypothetical protein [Gammaproteobacteria bacterium]
MKRLCKKIVLRVWRAIFSFLDEIGIVLEKFADIFVFLGKNTYRFIKIPVVYLVGLLIKNVVCLVKILAKTFKAIISMITKIFKKSMDFIVGIAKLTGVAMRKTCNVIFFVPRYIATKIGVIYKKIVTSIVIFFR